MTSQYTIGETHKSLTGKTRLNDEDLEVFICDSDCNHSLYFLDKPDCIGEFYSAKYLVALIKGEK